MECNRPAKNVDGPGKLRRISPLVVPGVKATHGIKTKLKPKAGPMPNTPNRPCQRCKQILTTSTYCSGCQVIQDAKWQAYRQEQDRRPSPRKRGYDTAWEKARSWQLKRFPLCQDCQDQGIIGPANVVHHIESVEDRPDLRLDPENLRSLCFSCHEIFHGRQSAGVDLGGYPKGKGHPWVK